MIGTVKILHANSNADAIVASAGRISTTKGTADGIYEKSCAQDTAGNRNLIEKVLSSGHLSVLEHVYFNLSFNNVSVLVEQFMIEFRLASFTVKSRRYVDFTDMGYYKPDFGNATDLEAAYDAHIRYLFGEYAFLLESGVPKEDARFVLPYAFLSNFYCSMNARELVRVVREMLTGRGRTQPEIFALGKQLLAEIQKDFPYLPLEDAEDLGPIAPIARIKQKKADTLVSLLRATDDGEDLLREAYALQYGDTEANEDILPLLLQNTRQRELEQLSFTVRFNKISLASLTHLARHRMHALIVPDFRRVCHYDNYVIPQSVLDAGVGERYKNIFLRAQKAEEELLAMGLADCDRSYLFLSGLTIAVMTTMNAHELLIFFRLRTCNRAQWEIKDCADELLALLRKTHPSVFSKMGPACYLLGRCPEGKMTCGEMRSMQAQYKA